MFDGLTGDDVLVMHNQIADSVQFTRHGIRIPFSRLHDTMVMAYVLNEPELGLKSLAARHCGMRMTTLDEITGSGKKEVSVLDLPQADLVPYACADADATRRLYIQLEARLAQEPSLQYVYEQIERPLFEPLVDMQIRGVLVDWDVLADIGRDVDEVIQTELGILQGIAGFPLNPDSDKQLHEFVYGQLGYPVQTNSKTGHASLDKKAIVRLRQLANGPAPFLEHLLAYNEAVTLKTRYIDGLRKQAGPDGLLHPIFKQCGTATGRFSSEGPNYQNMPIRTQLGSRIREAFVSPPGMQFVGGDYSQLELRTLALVTQDRKLTAEFNASARTGEPFDIHSWVAQHAGIPRRAAKIITFGRMFGQGSDAAYLEVVFNFQEAGEVPPSRAEFDKMYREHARILSALPALEAQTRTSVLNRGYVETYYGRRMVCDQPRGPAFRSALSMGPQGTGGDAIKLAIPAVWKLGLGARLVGTVHDELSCYCPDQNVEEFSSALKETMESAVSWPVPLIAEVKHGKSWAEAH